MTMMERVDSEGDKCKEKILICECKSFDQSKSPKLVVEEKFPKILSERRKISQITRKISQIGECNYKKLFAKFCLSTDALNLQNKIETPIPIQNLMSSLWCNHGDVALCMGC